MKKIRRNCSGIDIGAKKIFIAVEDQEVKTFDTFTSSFHEAKNYLLSHNIETVAMEATGVYWVILYEILEESGLDVWLVDGRQTKQVPGRKTDGKDCQWIQELHAHGLLKRCFIPDEQVKKVRMYQRLREDHIRSSAMHINHMQKALTQMNIRLKEVLSQLHGKSGLAMIKAILEGERNPRNLLALCHTSLRKRKEEEILKALVGHYSEEGIFALGQAYQGYLFYQDQIADCDKALNNLLETSYPNDDIEKLEKRKPIRHNKPKIDNLGGYLKYIFGGKDATVLPGITDYSWLQIYSAVGNHLQKWKTEKKFTSWLGLAPSQHQSGKMSKNVFKKHNPKAGLIFRQIAQSLIESKKIGLGVFGRRIKAKRGPSIAIKATARKLAILFWRLMVKGLDYVEQGIEAYHEKMKLHKEKWLVKNANELGYQLIHNEAFS